ncbi:MAG: ABC transporter permease [Coriobacteriales bacterium]|jgi:putative ABC transport system permease protein|nr:ABC transporter permease [Coriobacteriales bacterium]
MYFKIAIRSVRLSLRDSALFFVSLSLGVCMFYAFNSVVEQNLVLGFNEVQADIVDLLSYLIGGVSILLAIAFGLLASFAVRYLVSRRRKEFSSLLMLGMGRGQIAAIFLLETLFIGLLSLLLGLLLGQLMAQILLFVSAMLFDVEFTGLIFFFSPLATMRAVNCFAVVFVVALAFGIVLVQRQRPENLLGEACQKGIASKSLTVTIILLCLSVACMGTAYILLVDPETSASAPFVASALTLVCLGTGMFFYSAVGCLLRTVQESPDLYLSGLKLFVLRQLNRLINATYVSMSLVCLALCLAVVALSTGFGTAGAFSGSLEARTRFDATYTTRYDRSGDPNVAARSGAFDDLMYDAEGAPGAQGEVSGEGRPDAAPDAPDGLASDPAQTQGDAEGSQVDAAVAAASYRVVRLAYSESFDMEAGLVRSVPAWLALVKATAQYDLYDTGIEMGDLYLWSANNFLGPTLAPEDARAPLSAVRLTQFNEVRVLLGLAPVELGQSGYLIWHFQSASGEVFDSYLRAGGVVEVFGQRLRPASSEADTTPSRVSMDRAGHGVLVVPDDVLPAGLLPSASYLDIMYNGERHKMDPLFRAAMASAYGGDGWQNANGWPFESGLTSDYVFESSIGPTVIASYLACYVGIVMLVCCAFVLSLQQLSDAVSSTNRYALLRRLGTEQRMLDRALLAQIGIYFALPFALSVAHAAVVVNIIKGLPFVYGELDFTFPLLVTAGIVALVYIGYILMTYANARKLLRQPSGLL